MHAERAPSVRETRGSAIRGDCAMYERVKEGLSVCMQGQNWKLLPLLIALNQRANILRLMPWYGRSSSVA
jgi:hypothetical protein